MEPPLNDDDLDEMVGQGLEPGLRLASFTLSTELRRVFPEPENVPLFPASSIDPSDETFLKLLVSNATLFLKTLPRCSEKQLLDGAEALSNLCRAVLHANQQYVWKGKTTQQLRLGRRVFVAKLITEEGVQSGTCSCSN